MTHVQVLAALDGLPLADQWRWLGGQPRDVWLRLAEVRAALAEARAGASRGEAWATGLRRGEEMLGYMLAEAPDGIQPVEPLAADVRNNTLGPVAQTIQRGGGGVSLNSIPIALVPAHAGAEHAVAVVLPDEAGHACTVDYEADTIGEDELSALCELDDEDDEDDEAEPDTAELFARLVEARAAALRALGTAGAEAAMAAAQAAERAWRAARGE